jgi:hypothetical protein
MFFHFGFLTQNVRGHESLESQLDLLVRGMRGGVEECEIGNTQDPFWKERFFI